MKQHITSAVNIAGVTTPAGSDKSMVCLCYSHSLIVTQTNHTFAPHYRGRYVSLKEK